MLNLSTIAELVREVHRVTFKTQLGPSSTDQLT